MRFVKILLGVFGVVSATFGQVGENRPNVIDSNHELKLNVFNVVAFQAIDINYEYIINENSALGLGVFHKFWIKEIEQEYLFTIEVVDHRKFSLTPYFRRYFSKGPTNGFFVETFAMLHSGREAYFDSIHAYNPDMETIVEPEHVRIYEPYLRFALGLSLGGKILLKKGVLLEFFTGIGASPFDEWSYMVTRGGFSFGLRF